MATGSNRQQRGESKITWHVCAALEWNSRRWLAWLIQSAQGPALWWLNTGTSAKVHQQLGILNAFLLWVDGVRKHFSAWHNRENTQRTPQMKKRNTCSVQVALASMATPSPEPPVSPMTPNDSHGTSGCATDSHGSCCQGPWPRLHIWDFPLVDWDGNKTVKWKSSHLFLVKK